MNLRWRTALVLFTAMGGLILFWHQGKTVKPITPVPEVKTSERTESSPPEIFTEKTEAPTSAKTAEVKPEIGKNCFAFEYQHRKEDRDRDIEEYLDDSNAFPILHEPANEKSICVKVNDHPVPFKIIHHGKEREILIGSVVGPESVIRIAYCLGKASCREACTPKTNAFMDELMSEGGHEKEFDDSWNENTDESVKQKNELKERAKQVRSLAGASDLNPGQTMRVWKTLQKQEWVCKK